MTGIVDQRGRRQPASAQLAERCRVFGLPVWRLSLDGKVLTSPTGWGPATTWIESPALRNRISTAAADWSHKTPTAVQLFGGAWLLPIPETDTATGNSCLAAAMALGPKAIVGDTFTEICRSARLDVDTAHRVLSRLARYDDDDVDHLAATLRAMHTDLETLTGHDETVDVFSRELNHTYEQISLLYKLGRSMNWLTAPGDFVQTTCNLLQGMLEFQWVAAMYDTPDGQTVRRSTVLSDGSSLPCRRADFERLAETLLDGIREDHWRTILEPDGSDLAKLVGSQVIAEPVMAGGHVTGLLMAGNKISDDPEVTSIETQLLDATADYLGAFLHNVALYDEQRDMFLGTVSALSAAIDAKDRYTRGHSERVAWLADRLAIAAGMGAEQAERVRIAGIVHDVGKIGVPEAVLQKPGKLTDKEFDLIRQHPEIGYNILKDIRPLQDVLPGVRYHHERWEGGGYPEGLAGERIPLFGRLLAVVDTFDAMSSNRAYRPAIARDRVLSEIATCAGTQFDPELAEAFSAVDLSGYDEMVASAAAREREAA